MDTEKTSYKELLVQHAALVKQIAAYRKVAIQRSRVLIESYGLVRKDVFPSAKFSRVVKYSDPATGLTWTGRGRLPNWIRDKDRSQFEMEQSRASTLSVQSNQVVSKPKNMAQ